MKIKSFVLASLLFVGISSAAVAGPLIPDGDGPLKWIFNGPGDSVVLGDTGTPDIHGSRPFHVPTGDHVVCNAIGNGQFFCTTDEPVFVSTRARSKAAARCADVCELDDVIYPNEPDVIDSDTDYRLYSSIDGVPIRHDYVGVPNDQDVYTSDDGTEYYDDEGNYYNVVGDGILVAGGDANDDGWISFEEKQAHDLRIQEAMAEWEKTQDQTEDDLDDPDEE